MHMYICVQTMLYSRFSRDLLLLLCFVKIYKEFSPLRVLNQYIVGSVLCFT